MYFAIVAATRQVGVPVGGRVDIFGFAGSVAALLVSRIVQGIGGGTIGVVQAYVTDASPPDRRTKSLGWLSAITNLGAVVGPAFGSVMASLGGRSLPGIVACVLSLVVAVFAWRYLRESWEPRLANGFGITEHNIGFCVMYLGGMGIVVRMLVLGRAVDRLGEVRLSRVGSVLLASGLAATGLARDYHTLALGFTLMPLGTAFLFPCVTGLLSRVVSSGERGLFMGVQHTFGGVSRVAFPLAAGVLMDQFGVGVPFWIAGLLVVATLPLASVIGSYD